jgi:hypothetical protein
LCFRPIQQKTLRFASEVAMSLKMLRTTIRILMILPFFPLIFPSSQAGLVWSQVARLNGVNGATHDVFGSSIAISGDTIVVGAPSAKVGENAYQGKAYVFVKPAAGWSGAPVPAATLVVSGGLADQHFGCAVAISGDTIAIGAYGVAVNSHSNQGAVYVFVKPANGWSGSPAQAAVLTASDGLALDGLGTAVSISGDTVVAGAFGAKIGSNNGQGAAYVFVKPTGGAWANHAQAAKLVAASGVAGEEFGYSVAIDGDTVVVGTNHSQGAAYVFVKPTAGWTGSPAQKAKLVDPDTTGQAYFGKAVAISGDTVAVSDSGADIGTHISQGAIYIYTRPAAGWSGSPASAAKLYASDGGEFDLLGSSIAISGSQVAGGAPYAKVGANDSQGAAYVFLKPAAGWSGTISKSIKLTASDGASNNDLGISVAISGNTLAAGAWNATVNGIPFVGTAYVFVGKNFIYLPLVKR